jgi:hypothetical protein
MRGTSAKRSGLAVLALFGISGILIASTAGSSGATSKAKTHHSSKTKKPKHKATSKKALATPCLVGNWTATNFALNNSGFSASGGEGTQVDIAANGDVEGHFTPGAPLKGPGGTYKFTGNEIGTYGFPKNTTAKSGTFPVTYAASSDLMISVNGGAPTPAGSDLGTGSYQCNGNVLTLRYPPGGNEVVYTLSPTK